MDTYLRIRQSLKRNRRKSLFIGGLIAAVMITSLPTIFYIWDPPEKDCSRSNSIGKTNFSHIRSSCSKGEAIDGMSLHNSPCSSPFNWSKLVEASSSRNISTLKCNFKDTEADLLALLRFWPALVEKYGEVCGTYARNLLCHHIYGDCGTALQPTMQTCLHVKDELCPELWETAQSTFNSLSGFVKCLSIPNCYTDFDNTSKAVTSLSLPGLSPFKIQ
jgi:hypothetical protein